MLQRFAYGKYRPWPDNKVLYPIKFSMNSLRYNDTRGLPVYGQMSNVRSLIDSATHGQCHLCGLFLNKITTTNTINLLDPPETSQCFVGIWHHKWPGRNMVLYDLQFGFRISDETWIRVELQLRPIDRQRIPAMPSGFEFPRTDIKQCSPAADAQRTTEEHRWMVVHQWLERCIETHEKCKSIAAMASNFTNPPSRLIDVGSAADYSDVRLRRTEGIVGPTQWITLSHCWGPKGIKFVLRYELLETFEEAVPFESLSRNFQDAIKATRTLSSRFGRLYLWIDALCIIQDSKEDWTTESVKMGHIYSNALCNLMACRGTDSSAGLFEERNQFSLHTCTFQGGRDGCLPFHWQVRDFTSFQYNKQNSTLLSRAWVHQEVNLSLRKIYFAPGQLYWECAERVHEEANPEVNNNAIVKTNATTLSLFRVEANTDLSREERVRQYYGTWVHIAESHSNYLITKDSDRLPSIASIAQVMHSLLGSDDEYIAGTWKRWFWLYILCQVLSPEDVCRAENGSPSWSWTSVSPQARPTGTGRVTFHPGAVLQNPNARNMRPRAEFFDAKVKPSIEGFDFGQVKSASIKAKATLLKLRALVRVDMTKIFKLMASLYWEDQEIPTALVPRLDYVEDWTTGWHILYCIVIAHDTDYQVQPYHERLQCLLLRKLENISATYIRCGQCQIVDLEPQSIWTQALKSQTGDNDLLEHEYHVKHGEGVYTITIE